VDDEPVVVRTFMTEAGARAIACGYPQRVHCAFDADRCRLALVWTGRFLNAAGAWAARGGTETDPDQPPAWTAPDRALFTTTDGRAMTARFLGYRLDDERRPVFRYELRSGSAAYDVSEQPIPHRGGEGEGGGPWMERRFEIRGPAGAALRVAGERDILLDGDGRAEFSLEVRW
jgi:hypothetical protein